MAMSFRAVFIEQTWQIWHWIFFSWSMSMQSTFVMYLGKFDPNCQKKPLRDFVVYEWLRPFFNLDVTTDNYFTSLDLCDELLSKNTSFMGTINRIRRELPMLQRSWPRNLLITLKFCIQIQNVQGYCTKPRK